MYLTNNGQNISSQTGYLIINHTINLIVLSLITS